MPRSKTVQEPRTRNEKAVVVVAACCTAWVVGTTLFYRSGGVNPAGLIPVVGCLTALLGALRSDSRLMWFGTTVTMVSAVAFVFSVGLAVVPAAVALVIGSMVLSRSSRTLAGG